MKVLLRNPRREIEVAGVRTVNDLLARLELNRESHLVIRNGTLVPGDGRLADDDEIEVRPVISGGQVTTWASGSWPERTIEHRLRVVAGSPPTGTRRTRSGCIT